MKTSYLACDIGNVLVNVSFRDFIDAITITNSQINSDQVLRFLERTQKQQDLGLINFRTALRDHFGSEYESCFDGWLAAWNKTLIVNKSMTKMMSKLHKQGTKIALLSNIGEDHSAYLDGYWSDQEWYREAIHHFSCRVGARKPSMLYYQSFLLQYPKFKGCVYVDDLWENLHASQGFGFQAFHFTLENPKYKTQIPEIMECVLEGKSPDISMRQR